MAGVEYYGHPSYSTKQLAYNKKNNYYGTIKYDFIITHLTNPVHYAIGCSVGNNSLHFSTAVICLHQWMTYSVIYEGLV